MVDFTHHPLPAFLVDHDLNIKGQSRLATELFSKPDSFLDFVDSGSKQKALELIKDQEEFELVLNTVESPYMLFKVFARWHDGEGQLLCVRQDSQIMELSSMLQMQRDRLAETNFDLLDKKEELEEAMSKIKRLSSPFLPISSSLSVIPLFGSLDEELFLINEQQLLSTLQNGNYEYVILDFNGIGEIEERGVFAFQSFYRMIQLIGVSPILSGLKPQHVFQLMENDFNVDQTFHITGSLKDAISQYNLS
ncbi:STAS domain-containing protein [Alkalihalobacillus sp. CinArs1]|uniref:STAS domain-containing protein n=1 Tax=Alkalihalobacillus sp. CinArs1 TaxID=2995314 RepID=UPI0022DD269F|nr:STAS domain-containing protein [Alkalihalobacillus sp. CinArs1]